MTKPRQSIDLDAHPIERSFFDSEAEFISCMKEYRKELNEEMKEDQTELLDQDEIVINSSVAYVCFDISELEGVVVQFPVFAYDPCAENRVEVSGITRGRLQWQIQNALSGLPLFDHRYPECLDFVGLTGSRPIYRLFLGS